MDGVSNNEVVKKGAYWVFWYISGRKSTLRNIPFWHRFPTYDGYLEFNEAKEARDNDFRQANEFYQIAFMEAPFNALVLLEWGDLNELNNQYLDALEIYMKAVLMWPHLYVFWYRIAAIFSCPDEWIDSQWKILEDDKKEYLADLIEKLFTENKLEPDKKKGRIGREQIKLNNQNNLITIINQLAPRNNQLEVPDNILTDNFYELASEIWYFLEEEINSMFIKWVIQVLINIVTLFVNVIRIEKNRKTNLHSLFTPYLARYYWKLIPLFPWQEGRQFLRSVQLSEPCTILQKGLPSTSDITVNDLTKEIEDIVKLMWNTMVIYYNAACYYAQLSAKDPQFISIALDYLKIAFKDRRTRLDVDWVQTDPDFKHLKLIKDPEYQALCVTSNKKEIDNESEIEKERKAKLDVFDLLQKGAQQQKKDWETTSDWSLSPEALIIEAEYQISLWDSLIKLFETPDDQLQRELFWQLVMQNAKASAIPATKKHNPNITLKKINETWENITKHAKPQLNTWKNRLEDCKLLLQKDDSPNPHGIINIWKQSETWQWFYLSKQIEVINHKHK